MITDGTKWHYVAVKTLSGLLRGITGVLLFELFTLIYHKNKLKKHKKICEYYGYCKLEMPKKGSVLKNIPGKKSIMTPFVIYADL